MNAASFAVLDFETTGLGDSDRVIEIGVVLLDPQGGVERTWETLVDPDQSFTNSDVHGITSDDIADAPYFDYIAHDLLTLLQGRIVVAHGLDFVQQFLRIETERAGVALPRAPFAVSTRQLSETLLGKESATLAECLSALGVFHEVPDTAIGRAVATTVLFQRLLPLAEDGFPGITPAEFATEDIEQLEDFRVAPLPRELAREQVPARSEWLQHFKQKHDSRLGRSGRAYWKVVAAALADGVVTPRELAGLLKHAAKHQLSADDIAAIHESFVHRLVVQAWADGVVSDQERQWVLSAAGELGVETAAVEALLDAPTTAVEQPELAVGDEVSFAGVMEFSREEWTEKANAVGLDVAGLSRNSALLVVADLELQSDLLQHARELGVAVVDEPTFALMLQNIHPNNADEPPHEPTDADIDFQTLFPWLPTPDVDPMSVVALWMAEHRSTPLVEMSTVLDRRVLPEGLSESSLAVRSWLARFPEPLTATVELLSDIRGVGAVRLEEFVYAVVLQVIDSSMMELDEGPAFAEGPVDYVAGWFDLIGMWPDATQSELAECPMPEHLANDMKKACNSGAKLMQRAVGEIEALLAMDTQRRSAILTGRATGAENLQTLGDRFGITRERIRQLEYAMLQELRANAPACETVVSACAVLFAPCMDIETVVKAMPGLAHAIEPATERTLLEVLTWVYGQPGVTFAQGPHIQWHIADGWMIFGDFETEIEACIKAAVDENGVLAEDQFLLTARKRFPRSDPHTLAKYAVERLGYTRRGPYLLPPRSSILVRVAVELGIRGEPMTTEELHEVLSDRSRGSIVNALGRSEIFVRSAMDTWALKEWGLEEWTNLSDFLLQRIEEHGGSVPLELLKQQAQQFGISEHSVGFYVSGPEYLLKDGMVSVNTEIPVNDHTPEDSKGMYFVDGTWRLLVTVTDDHLRGSGSAVPLGVAALYDLAFNEPFELPSRLGPQTLRWGRVNCSISTTRRFLEPLGVEPGDRVWFVFGDSFDVLAAPAIEAGLSPAESVLNAMGLVAKQDSDAIAQINTALGLDADAPRRQAVRRFRNRNDDELAEMLRHV